MDPTLSKADAHRVFGELYRKSRSPELQEQVDRIVNESSDIFVRLKRIEELDNVEARKSRLAREEPGTVKRTGVGGGGGTPGAGGAARKGAAKKERGFLSQLFGGDLAKWGKETGTLSTGFLALNIKISNRVDELFTAVPEEEVVAALKAFRHVAKVAWEAWDPVRYNTVMAAHLFFIEFGNVRNYPARHDNPQAWINQTLKMQKYYAILQTYPDYKRMITEDLPAYIKEAKEVSMHLTGIRHSMEFITKMEQRTPSFKNAVLAYYAMARKSVPSWEEVLTELQVKPPNLKSYPAPEDVLKLIQTKISKLKEKVVQRTAQVREVSDIKKSYFSFDESGKLQVEFLQPILEDVVRRVFPENIINEALIKAQKKEPQRLLYIILKDFDVSASLLLHGSVSTRGGSSHQEDVILFKPGLFDTRLEAMVALFRETEQFVKKYKNMTYSFSAFLADIKKEGADPIIQSFLQIVKSANAHFRDFANDFRTVLQNHRGALAMEGAGKVNEKIIQTKSIAIESCALGSRFVPFAQNEITSSGRYNGFKVIDALQDIARNLYNYLYIFRDEELIRIFTSVAPLQAEINSAQAELARMGITPEEVTPVE